MWPIAFGGIMLLKNLLGSSQHSCIGCFSLNQASVTHDHTKNTTEGI